MSHDVQLSYFFWSTMSHLHFTYQFLCRLQSRPQDGHDIRLMDRVIGEVKDV